MARRVDSVRLPKDLVEDLFASSLRLQEVLETLEVLLDKKTVKRLKTSMRQEKRGQYKVAKTEEDIHKILSS